MANLIDPGLGGTVPPGTPPPGVQPKDWAVQLGQRMIDWLVRETPATVQQLQSQINAFNTLSREG